MNVLIPAICKNKHCGAVWFAPNIVTPNLIGEFNNCTMSPCPKCGGEGRIPNGRYALKSGQIFEHRDLEIILSAINDLQKRLESGASADDIRKEISRNPILDPLKKYLPTNATELNAYLATLMLLATLLVSQCSKGPAPAPNPAPVVNVYVMQEISEVLEKVIAARNTSQPNIQTVPPEQSPAEDTKGSSKVSW